MNQAAIDSIKAERDAAVRERDDARLNSATDLERLIQVEEIIVKQTERIAGLAAEHDAYQRAADDMAAAHKVERDAMADALNAAGRSLETISLLAGRKTYGNPPIETFMATHEEVRAYAASRASAALKETK